MNERIDRRGLLGTLAKGAGMAGLAQLAATPASAAAPSPGAPVGTGFHYCLNTSTIRGQKLSLPAEMEIAAKAGYHAVEPWIGEIDAYVKEGGSLKDLGKLVADLGLTVESLIAFPEWILDDDARRAKGLEEAKRCLDIAAQIGGKRIAAPAAGAKEINNLSLPVVAERYRAVLELGDSFGVVPQVEFWGHSQTLGRLSEATYVAIEARHPKACVLADVYHLHKGGSGIAGLHLLGPQGMHVMHLNDYPAEPGRKDINDSQRVYPGDGVAPLKEIFRILRNSGFHGYLSLELFNRNYWQQDPFEVARTGLEKTRVLVQASLEA
jgi:sugar phosphate isomerase/epimerase